MISKELLTALEVIKIGNKPAVIKEIYGLGSNPNLQDNDLPFSIEEDGNLYFVNIYELAHKCKEWAKNNGYVIGTDLDRVNVWSIKDRKIVNNFEVYWEDYTEYEIKACEWILKEQNEK